MSAAIIDLEITAATNLPTRYGVFRMESFRTPDGGTAEPHLALSMGLDGRLHPGAHPAAHREVIPLVRIHSECITSEVFGSERCDCGPQLREAMRSIGEAGCGIVIYLRQEGRGIGIENKLQAYALQELGMDTVDSNLALGLPVDPRTYDCAVSYLRHLDIGRCILLTNNPNKETALHEQGIEVTRAPLICEGHAACRDYLATKRRRMGHDC